MQNRLLSESDNLKVEWWTCFFREHFDISISNRIPQQREGFDCLIIVPGALRVQRVLDKMSRMFLVDSSMCLDNPFNERTNYEKGYAVWAKDVREVCEGGECCRESEGENSERLPSMTFIERLLLGMMYFLDTGSHLDQDGKTLCTGTLSCVGIVPTVGWDSEAEKLKIEGSLSTDWCRDARPREVIQIDG